MKFEVNSRTATRWLLYWLVGANVFVWLSHITNWPIFKIGTFLCLVFLPGAVILRLLQTPLKNMGVRIAYRFGLSVLVLILCGLCANQLLYLVGIDRPLSLITILVTWDVIVLMLVFWAWKRNRHPSTMTLPLPTNLSYPARIFLFLSFLTPILAMFGAFRLNNGAGSALAEIALCYIAVLIIYAFAARKHLHDGMLAWFIFIVGFSVLLMTSLRGWDIVGHDIEREFRVFSLTHLNGYWNIAADRNPYNACLSITILPEMFVQLMNISGLVVFKVILQIIFAMCPVVLFFIMRRYVSRGAALFGGLLFICYPTFINDSAMLTRQGVAYLFFALALYILSEQSQKRVDKILFLLCAIGAILSHYSTAYMFVALFAAGVFCKMLIIWFERRQGHITKSHRRRTVLTPFFAIVLFLFTFMWYSQITGTSGGLATTLRTSFANIPQLFSKDNKSSDTSTALFFAGGKSQADLYFSYVTEGANHVPPQTDIPYMPQLTDDNLPVTQLGERMKGIGIDPTIVTTLRQNFARLLQLLALLGVVYISYKLIRHKNEHVHLDYVSLSLAGLLLLALMVLLPVLSINYGILRAFQQALIFLTLPIVLFLVTASSRLNMRIRRVVGCSSIVFIFLLFTGWFAQILGGTSPALSLNNRGLYYGLYYTSDVDAASFQWIKQHFPKSANVRAANFNRAAMHDPAYPFSHSHILPSQLGKNSIVYLDASQMKAQRFYVYHESSPLIMTFPLNYYDQAKDRVYSTESTGVYK